MRILGSWQPSPAHSASHFVVGPPCQQGGEVAHESILCITTRTKCPPKETAQHLVTLSLRSLYRPMCISNTLAKKCVTCDALGASSTIFKTPLVNPMVVFKPRRGAGDAPTIARNVSTVRYLLSPRWFGALLVLTVIATWIASKNLLASGTRRRTRNTCLSRVTLLELLLSNNTFTPAVHKKNVR